MVDADRICVLDGGRIVERDRHGELLVGGGIRAGLWCRQAEERPTRAAVLAER